MLKHTYSLERAEFLQEPGFVPMSLSTPMRKSSLAEPTVASSTARPVAFFADTMLGKLARWLRILGYDTAYERDIPDVLLVERVLQENRWLLTRDRYLAKRRVLRDRLTLVRSDWVAEQLHHIAGEHHLNLTLNADTPCRCALCNHVLEPLSQRAAAPKVPPYVALQHDAFAHCPGCGHIYWPGTHWDRIRERLESLRTP